MAAEASRTSSRADTAASTQRAFAIDDMRRDIAALIGVSSSEVGDDDDLIGLGVDSLGVMKLASKWRRSGLELKFAELFQGRTLNDWWKMAEPRVRLAAANSASTAIDENALFELAPMQHAYWIGRGEEQVLGCGCHYYFEFDGHEIDPQRLDSAVRLALKRHAMLRARFTDDGRQQVLAQSPWPGLSIHDLRDLAEEERQNALDELRERESNRRMEVESGHGFDVQLSLLPEGAARVHVNVDMLVSDAASFRVVIDEIARVYADPDTPLPPIGYSYQRYLRQKAERRTVDQTAQAYWETRFAELSGPPRLPLAAEPASVRRPQPVRRECRLSGSEVSELSAKCREHGVTLPWAIAAAFVETLAAWSSEPRFVLNVPLFDRENLHSDVPLLCGDFSNSILLAVDASANLPFFECARRLQSRFHTDIAYSSCPGVDVMRAAAKAGAPSGLGAVVFTSAIGMGDLFGPQVKQQFGRLAWIISQTAQAWLDCQVTELDGGLLINWDSVKQLLPYSVLDALFEAFTGIIANVRQSSEVWKKPIGGLLPEKQRLVRDRVNSSTRKESGRLLHDGFFARAALNPERMALAWGTGSQMSYGDLSLRARKVGQTLIERGVKPGDRVAVTMRKGPGQIVAVIGILSAGAAYVPVNIDHPHTRRATLYNSAGVRILVTDEPAELPGITALTLQQCEDTQPLAEPLRVSALDLAYVIFTSGSTGQPKGVLVPHRAAMNTIEDILERFNIRESDRVLAVSALDFDWSVADIFEFLSVGGAVVLIDEDSRRDAGAWAEIVRHWGVTVWQSSPALLDMLLVAAGESGLGDGLRIAMLGGDWVGLDLHPRLHRVQPGCRLVALGGITETAIHCTVFEVDEVPPDWRSIPYGVPLTNVKCRVVDARGRDCPDGVTGELWVGGAGVANGYLHDPAPDKFVTYQGERWYRSGDLARYRPDGILEFLGRADSQVKILGHRIETGEIQATLLKHPGVANAYVIALGQPRRLAAAVTPACPSLRASELSEFLARHLPAYMRPEHIVITPVLPLTSNGKLDRNAISRLLESTPLESASADPPRPGMEETVARVWAKLLSVPRVGRDDSFFALGGDSLSGTRMIAELKAAGVSGAEIRRIFSKPRLKDFAAELTSASRPALAPQLLPDPEHQFDPFPLTEIQRAYWLGRHREFALGGVGSYWYWEFDGAGVDVGRIETAVNILAARHPMLRTIIDDDGRQRVLAETPPFRISATSANAEDEAASLGAFRAGMSHRLMDPTQWPLFDIRAIHYGVGRTRVGFGFDFIALDALSIMLFFAELSALYKDPGSALPPIGVTFRDYVAGPCPAARDVARAREYWMSRLDNLPAAPQLPLRIQPGEIEAPRFVRRSETIPAAEWSTIAQRARAFDLTRSTVLAAAFAEVLGTWAGEPELTLNFTLFDRQDVHPDINRVLGDFTSLLLVPYSPTAGETWVENARSLQNEVAAGMENRLASAIWVLRERSRKSDLAQMSMPVVFTSTIGVADDLIALSTPFGEYAGGLSQTPQVWLDCQVIEDNDQLLINWDSVDGLFPEEMLDSMFAAYRQLLGWLASKETEWQSPVPDLVSHAELTTRAAINSVTADFPTALLHEGVFAGAREHPERLAVGGCFEPFTYERLGDRALRIAAYIRSLGLDPGGAVMVRLPAGPDQIAAVLGVLAAGCAYIPVALDAPRARHELVSATTRAAIDTESLGRALERAPLPAPILASPDSLAYVIYTSGSTGTPKGVEMCHAAAMNTIADVNRRFAVGSTDRVLAVSELNFDLSVYDMFGLLSVGGAVIVPTEEERREPRRWVELVREWNVTIWNSVPALFDMFLIVAANYGGSQLRLALVSGDWIPLALPPRLRRLAASCRFVALGGATEAGIWSNWFDVAHVDAEWRSIPYGRPLSNQKFRVVDSRGRDCPNWTPGELWIGGKSVASGYRNDTERTAVSFVEWNGERWYRTGDLGRYWPNNVLEFLGRSDQQVKIGGHRVELGEIEAALAAHPGVSSVRVLAVSGTSRGLAGWFVPKNGRVPAEQDLRSFLADRLPAYMIPDVIFPVDHLPLSANGKIDRRTLVEMLEARTGSEHNFAPSGAVEEKLAALWRELLGPQSVRRDRTFFSLGGDSLMAMRLVEAVRGSFRLDISLRQFFATPTLPGLAALIEAERLNFEEGVA